MSNPKISHNRFDNIKTELLNLKNLEKALRFLEAQQFPLDRMEVIAQDEFSHDVVVPYPENSPNFLAIGVT